MGAENANNLRIQSLLSERIGVAAEKLAVVRCGVSFAMLPAVPVFEHRESYRIGTLGRLVEKKGIDVLIRAVAELRNRPCSIELSIADVRPADPR